MYNRYISDPGDYAPVAPISSPPRPSPPPSRGAAENHVNSAASLLSMLTGNKDSAVQLLRGKLGNSQEGIWKRLRETGIDAGDILLVLIILLLMTQEEETDVLLALGAVLLFDGEGKKKREG